MSGQVNWHDYADLLYDASKNNRNATPNYGPYEKLFLSDWGQSKIHYDILQAFDKINISRMTPIQQNSFLYLMDNYNTAMIGFSKGKSVSYLASIFSSIMNNSGDKMDNVHIGPKAVILSNSLGSCNDLNNLANILISLAKKENKIKVVAVYTSISVQSSIAAICNGCDILIATPTSLLNVLNKTKIITWSNLRYFVFDNIDILLDNYEDQMIYFLKTLKKLKENTNNLQLISASVKWTKKIDEFLNLLFVKWQYIFGSHLEAARYMKIGFNVVLVKDDKLRQILKYLKNNMNCCRCVLIASNADELLKISNFIQQNDSNIEVLLPGKIKSATVYMLQDWNKPLVKSQRVMICSDDNMFDFYIDNADCLIHYDIPVDKETFSIRFSVLQDSNNLFVKKKRSTYVFLNSSFKDMLHLPKIVEVMKLFGNSEVEPILQKHAKIINETLEKEKKNCLFCINIQQFGCCTNPTTCQYRHILFKELDEPAVNIPKSGFAIIKILNIYDASHMSAKLLKLNCTNNLNDDQHWSTVEDYFNTVNHKINSFYSNPNFRILHRNPKFSDVVAIELKIKIREHMSTEYYRAIVIDNKIDENTMYPKVKVKLIDLGFVEIVPKLQVFVLPDMLKNVPTSTVDLFLANVKPCDLDKKWCSQVDVHIKNEFKFIDICNHTIIVKIKMALGTTIWINKLYTKYWNIKLKKYDFEIILPDVLFNARYADLNTEHIENFKNLCISADININANNNNTNNDNDNSIIKEEENHEIDVDKFMSLYKLPQPQWAHLDQSSNLVVVEYVISPKIIFVRNFKYLDRCTDLLSMIERYIDQKQVKELEHIVVGAICLAKHPELNKYCRIKIIDILDSEYVEVLFVDLGHFYNVQKSTLLTIHSNLITQLPFQAIECGLNGVKNTLSITENELDELVVYIINLTESSMYFEIVDPVLPAKYTDGNHYEVILYNENITVNYEFQTNFGQYCDLSDSIQIANTEDSISAGDTNLENDNNYYNERPCLINESNLCEDNDMESDKQLYEAFAQAFFGPETYERLKENGKVIEDINKEGSLKTTEEITSVTPTPDEECDKDSADIELAGEIKTIDSATLKTPSTVLKQRKSKNVTRKCKNVCLTCNTNVQSIVPLCKWHQDKNHIYIKLNVLEMDDFNISHTMESITFSARFKDASYTFRAVLYASIFDHNVTSKRSFEGFHITAEKLYKTDYEWPRLFACRKAHSYLKYDPEHIRINDDVLNIWIREVGRLKFIAVGKSLNTVVDDDSHVSSSDDDDKKYGQFIDDLTEQ